MIYLYIWYFLCQREKYKLTIACSIHVSLAFFTVFLVISPFSLHPEEHVDKIVGEKLELNCSVSNSNGYQIEWFVWQNGTRSQISDSSTCINITHSTTHSSHELSILSICLVNLSHAGVYVCRNGFTYSKISHVEIQCELILKLIATTLFLCRSRNTM